VISEWTAFGGTGVFGWNGGGFLAGLSTRFRGFGTEGPVPYGGGYREYVARSGHEAPGLR
jgi:hypothetical protein